MKTVNILSFLVIIISFIIALYFYDKMPDMMASHWNMNGEVDDYIPKFW